MPPRGGRHRGGGRGRGYPVPYPVGPWWGGDGGTTVIVNEPSCVAYDTLGTPRVVPCPPGMMPMGDTPEVTIIDESPRRVLAPSSKGGMLIRSAINIANGNRRAGSSPYFRFGAQTRSYPFDWHGWPGGVPSSRVAGETRELSGCALAGGGDLYESGLSPYTMDYPPLAHRGFRPPGLSGFLDDLSTNEKRLLGLAAVGGVAFFAMHHLKRKRRRNPARRRRRARR
jgi:hypothetical protein